MFRNNKIKSNKNCHRHELAIYEINWVTDKYKVKKAFNLLVDSLKKSRGNDIFRVVEIAFTHMLLLKYKRNSGPRVVQWLGDKKDN